ncbi:hypothetical protein [Paraburkholderia sp. MM6662-R1]|uniref:hypothetical protein n=1 Tax=Paraburkholderia sp. MM6662-R1 TaxID=2991066 RepID=UPI003D1ADB26
MRIAIIESPNPIDVFAGVDEARALDATCKLIGHQTASFAARSRAELQTICKYLSSADSAHAVSRTQKSPLFIHISSHGNDQGLAFGADFIEWDGLALDLLPILKNEDYLGRTVLCLSACGSGEQKIHRVLKQELNDRWERVPLYIVSIRGETVLWADALVGWTLFYHKISKINLADHKALVKIFDEIEQCVQVQFSYHRYNESQGRFVFFPSRPNQPADTGVGEA